MRALVDFLGAAAFTVRVAAERPGFLYFTSRAGARRQLLQQRRGPRAGGGDGDEGGDLRILRPGGQPGDRRMCVFRLMKERSRGLVKSG